MMITTTMMIMKRRHYHRLPTSFFSCRNNTIQQSKSGIVVVVGPGSKRWWSTTSTTRTNQTVVGDGNSEGGGGGEGGGLSLSQLPLSPLDVKGTLSILEPKFWYLSPCWGAAVSSSPAIGNLLRFGQQQQRQQKTTNNNNNNENKNKNRSSSSSSSSSLKDAGQLATLLMMQPDRFQPVRPIRTKSMVASYLTPSRIGMIIGLSSFYQQHPKKAHRKKYSNPNMNPSPNRRIPIPDKIMLQELQQVGVNKSNHVDNQWTGISLARWKELIQLSTFSLSSLALSSSSYQHQHSHSFHYHHWTQALWLQFLWQTVTTKQDLLDYLLAIEDQYVKYNNHKDNKDNNNSSTIVFNTSSELAQALRYDPIARIEWCNDSFQPQELLRTGSSSSSDGGKGGKEVTDQHHHHHWDQLEQDILYYMNDQQQYPGTTSTSTTSDAAAATEAAAIAIEEMCARWTIQTTNTYKSQHKTSKYSYDGSSFTKPDCVEVTIREVIDLLLWDEWSLNGHRLPNTTKPELIQLYNNTTPSKTTASTMTNTTNSTTRTGSSMSDNNKQQQQQLPPAVENDGNKDNNDTVGQRWFNLLSNHPTCIYLSKSPNGKSFELTPTLANVAEATRLLLTTGNGNDGENTSNSKNSDDELSQRQWTSLEELATFWNQHQKRRRHHHQKSSKNLPLSSTPTIDDHDTTTTDKYHRLVVSSRIHSFRQAMAEEFVHQEIATLSLVVDEDENYENDTTATTIASIELRLDKARQTSTVTHLQNQQHLVQNLSPSFLNTSTASTTNNNNDHDHHNTNNDGTTPTNHPWFTSLLQILSMVEQGNTKNSLMEFKGNSSIIITTTVAGGNDDHAFQNNNNSFCLSPVDRILCTRLGPDRRVLDPTLGTLDLTRRRQASRRAYNESCEILWSCLRLACQLDPSNTGQGSTTTSSSSSSSSSSENNNNCKNDEQAAILSWLISETPVVVVDNATAADNMVENDDASQPTSSVKPSKKSKNSIPFDSHAKQYWNGVERILVQELGNRKASSSSSSCSLLLQDPLVRFSIREIPMGELGIRRLDVHSGNLSIWKSLEGLSSMETIHLVRKLLLS